MWTRTYWTWMWANMNAATTVVTTWKYTVMVTTWRRISYVTAPWMRLSVEMIIIKIMVSEVVRTIRETSV